MTGKIKKQYEELKSGTYEISRCDSTEKELKTIAPEELLKNAFSEKARKTADHVKRYIFNRRRCFPY